MIVRYIHHIIGIVLCATIGWLLVSCQSDSGDTPEESGAVRELRLSLGTQPFSDGGSAVRTRALPAGFDYYDDATALSPIDQVQAYMTYLENGNWKYTSTVFNYRQADQVWTSRVPLKDAPHYVYGFMPKSGVGGKVDLTPLNGAYSNGAVMTFHDLDVVIPNDLLVVVGAAAYKNPENPVAPDMANGLGKFLYDTSLGSDDSDYLFLLVDHVYAGLRFKMKLGDNYSKLRRIKVRSIKLTPDNGDDAVVESVTAVVKIVANDEGRDPVMPWYDDGGRNISGEVTFPSESFKTGKNPKPAVLYDGLGQELTTTPWQFLACFCASTNSQYTLETKYDVYDRKGGPDGTGRMIREGETVRNKIILTRSLSPGQTHTVNIVVEPTYLYVMSDPDLDNPTFKVSSD